MWKNSSWKKPRPTGVPSGRRVPEGIAGMTVPRATGICAFGGAGLDRSIMPVWLTIVQVSPGIPLMSITSVKRPLSAFVASFWHVQGSEIVPSGERTKPISQVRSVTPLGSTIVVELPSARMSLSSSSLPPWSGVVTVKGCPKFGIGRPGEVMK